jgi:penicillin-binding protein 1A
MDNRLDIDERFYAQLSFKDDISLAEYELASKKLDAEEKAFLWATNTTSVLAPVIWFFGYSVHVDWTSKHLQSDTLPIITTVFIIFSIFFSVMSILHVANSRRNRVYAERKIVLLRRSMGVTYGSNSLVLPSWRLEGADNPFSLILFPGYFSYSSFPIFLLASFSALTIGLSFDNVPLGSYSPKDFLLADPSNTAMLLGVVWFLASIFIFRLSLREQNENYLLWVARFSSNIFRIPLVSNVEYNMYRCKLEIAEASRISVEFAIILDFAISIEDKLFFQHGGVSWRGILRAFWQYARRGKKSGASTITQQCARTNFVSKLTPAWRRKIVEIFLARWLESVLNKNEIVRIYLTTARFDRGIYGFHRALNHYFPDISDLDKATSFILIERLGNIHSLFLGERIRQLLQRLKDERLLDDSDIIRVSELYEQLIQKGTVENRGQQSPSEIAGSIK